jgi:hypothetical protein
MNGASANIADMNRMNPYRRHCMRLVVMVTGLAAPSVETTILIVTRASGGLVEPDELIALPPAQNSIRPA